MRGAQEFEDLEVWRRARQLTKVVYDLTALREFYRDRGLREQIRRAAVSAMSNIAEGFERRGAEAFRLAREVSRMVMGLTKYLAAKSDSATSS